MKRRPIVQRPARLRNKSYIRIGAYINYPLQPTGVISTKILDYIFFFLRFRYIFYNPLGFRYARTHTHKYIYIYFV